VQTRVSLGPRVDGLRCSALRKRFASKL
jgi:hypothetical protein